MLGNCKKMFVSGINANATLAQVATFFKVYTPNVVNVYDVRSNNPAIQNVVVEYADQRSALQAIDTVNFKSFDGFMMKAYLFHQEVFDANKNEKSNVTLHIPFDFDMEHITERFVYDIMKRFGPIINIGVRKDLHMVFCHFITEESALSAINAKYEDGIRCEHKTTPKPRYHRVNTKNMKNTKFMKQENEDHITFKLVDQNFPSFEELSKPKMDIKASKINTKKNISIEKTGSTQNVSA